MSIGGLVLWLAEVGGPEALVNVSQLGVAGLMGGLWWWERKYSRQREDELSEAHEAFMQQREHFGATLDALQQNTRAISAFTVVQQEIVAVLREKDGGKGAEKERAGVT